MIYTKVYKFVEYINGCSFPKGVGILLLLTLMLAVLLFALLTAWDFALMKCQQRSSRTQVAPNEKIPGSGG